VAVLLLRRNFGASPGPVEPCAVLVHVSRVAAAD
jgi:hypothetical protein